jgi:hypothetical protein
MLFPLSRRSTIAARRHTAVTVRLDMFREPNQKTSSRVIDMESDGWTQ